MSMVFAARTCMNNKAVMTSSTLSVSKVGTIMKPVLIILLNLISNEHRIHVCYHEPDSFAGTESLVLKLHSNLFYYFTSLNNFCISSHPNPVGSFLNHLDESEVFDELQNSESNLWWVFFHLFSFDVVYSNIYCIDNERLVNYESFFTIACLC